MVNQLLFIWLTRLFLWSTDHFYLVNTTSLATDEIHVESKLQSWLSRNMVEYYGAPNQSILMSAPHIYLPVSFSNYIENEIRTSILVFRFPMTSYNRIAIVISVFSSYVFVRRWKMEFELRFSFFVSVFRHFRPAHYVPESRESLGEAWR